MRYNHYFTTISMSDPPKGDYSVLKGSTMFPFLAMGMDTKPYGITFTNNKFIKVYFDNSGAEDMTKPEIDQFMQMRCDQNRLDDKLFEIDA